MWNSRGRELWAWAAARGEKPGKNKENLAPVVGRSHWPGMRDWASNPPLFGGVSWANITGVFGDLWILQCGKLKGQRQHICFSKCWSFSGFFWELEVQIAFIYFIPRHLYYRFWGWFLCSTSSTVLKLKTRGTRVHPVWKQWKFIFLSLELSPSWTLPSPRSVILHSV